MALKRTPDEILTVLDEAQAVLDRPQDYNGIEAGSFDLRGLLWEVLYDVLETIHVAEQRPSSRLEMVSDGTWLHSNGTPSIYTTVEDYIGNHYGDD